LTITFVRYITKRLHEVLTKSPLELLVFYTPF